MSAPNPLGGRCLNLTLSGDESVDDVMRLTGLKRESAAEIHAFARRLAAKPRHFVPCRHCGEPTTLMVLCPCRADAYKSVGGFPMMPESICAQIEYRDNVATAAAAPAGETKGEQP